MRDKLNSTLIEGVVVGDPIFEDGHCEFELNHARKGEQINPGEWTLESSTFTVIAHGSLGRKCREYLRAGKDIRVVGRLKRAGTDVQIIAKYVEFGAFQKTA